MAGMLGGASTPDPRQQHGPSALSPSRLKKREADRKAQRIAREKTKARITHLENLVRELSNTDDGASTMSLKAQLSDVTKQNDRLIRCLEMSSSLFNKHLSEAKEVQSRKRSYNVENHSQPIFTSTNVLESSGLDISAPCLAAPEPATRQTLVGSAHPENAENDFHSLANEPPPNLDLFWMDRTLPLYTAPSASITTPAIASSLSAFEQTADEISFSTAKASINSLCSCSKTTRTRRLSDGLLVNCNNWRAGNDILREPLAIPRAILELEYQASEDIPVQVVLYGWDKLARSGRMTPLWKKVRQLDELCFTGCAQPERLAVLFMIHLLMRAYVDPMPAKSLLVPQWYLKSARQLQQMSPLHEPIADYFTWPGLRYRFASTPHRYCHNLFWHLFREHMRITWPFEFRDCYVQNVQIGTYSLSPLFKDRLRDLRAWTMEPDFFLHYPELRQDIPELSGQPFITEIFARAPMNQELAEIITKMGPSLPCREDLEVDQNVSASRKDGGGVHSSTSEHAGSFILDNIGIEDDIDSFLCRDPLFDITSSVDTRG